MPRRSKKWSYEESVTQLEEIIQEIESGDLPLEAVFSQFAIAVEHLQKCEEFLHKGKKEMNLLIETLEDEAEF